MSYQFRLREEPFEFYSDFDDAEESLAMVARKELGEFLS